MKLLLINDYGFSGGGSENRIRLLLEELLRRKVFEEIHIIASRNVSSFEGIKIHDCGQKNAFFFTRKIIKENNIDIVQVHNLADIGPWPVVAAKLLKKPVVFFAHDYWPVCGRRSFIPAETASKEMLCQQTSSKCFSCIGVRSSLKLKMWKRLIGLADMGVSATLAMKSIYEKEGVLRGKWYVVPPWIHLEKFSQQSKIEKKGSIMLFVSSLIEWKGAWVVAKALKAVAKEVPDAQLVFIGDSQGPELKYRQDIEEICRNDGVLSHVQFLGKQGWDEIQEWHQRAKVFVFPTICMESFGLAWAEAMASGCPVVVSDVGSVAELATRAKIVKARDSDELAKAVIEIFKDDHLAENMSLWGRQYALENFDVRSAANKMIDIYEHFVSKKELI